MTLMVNIHEAKTHLSRLLEKVSEGEEVILARQENPLPNWFPGKKPGPEKRELLKADSMTGSLILYRK